MTGSAQTLRDFFNMGRANLAAATDDGGPLVNPAHDMVGIKLGREIPAHVQCVNGGGLFEKAIADLFEPVGIGTKWQFGILENVQGCRDHLGCAAVDQNRSGPVLDNRQHIGQRLARTQARAIGIVHRQRDPDRFAKGQSGGQHIARMIHRGNRFTDQQVAFTRQLRGHLNKERHRHICRWVQIRAVTRPQRPDGARHAARPIARTRGLCFGHRHGVQIKESPLHLGAGQPIKVDGIAVCRGNGGPGGKEVRMHPCDHPRMVNHDLRGPKWRGLVPGAVHQFLPHAPIQQCDICHARSLSFCGSHSGWSGCTVAL
mmetsp:Transcript_28628/g.53935  ORF Transcript_28628/g.53935 Transcript_28628/m.53935 type:complete len:315 (-) Transcript_28628:7605-8549(-)